MLQHVKRFSKKQHGNYKDWIFSFLFSHKNRMKKISQDVAEELQIDSTAQQLALKRLENINFYANQLHVLFRMKQIFKKAVSVTGGNLGTISVEECF